MNYTNLKLQTFQLKNTLNLQNIWLNNETRHCKTINGKQRSSKASRGKLIIKSTSNERSLKKTNKQTNIIPLTVIQNNYCIFKIPFNFYQKDKRQKNFFVLGQKVFWKKLQVWEISATRSLGKHHSYSTTEILQTNKHKKQPEQKNNLKKVVSKKKNFRFFLSK